MRSLLIKFPLFLAVLFVGGCASMPVDQDGPQLEILRFGLYEPLGAQHAAPAEDTAAGYTTTGEAYFIRSGNKLSVRKTQGFGFTYKVFGLKGSGEIEEEVIVSHPNITSPSGEKFTRSTVIQLQPFENGEYENDWIYYFSQDFEMVGGNWTFEIKNQGKTILKKSFDITPVL